MFQETWTKLSNAGAIALYLQRLRAFSQIWPERKAGSKEGSSFVMFLGWGFLLHLIQITEQQHMSRWREVLWANATQRW